MTVEDILRQEAQGGDTAAQAALKDMLLESGRSPFKKTVRLGTAKTYGGRAYSIFCKIEWSERNGGMELSISGVEGPTPSGNCLGGCGQIDMHLRAEQGKIKLAPRWTRAKLAQFFEVWERWHLNCMRAGNAAQEDYLRAHPIPEGTADHYRAACTALEAAGLSPDPATGYRYGHSWVPEDVPQDVLDFLRSLPDTDRQPAWC